MLSPSQLSHYQLVFKLLLVLKLTERQLSLTWHRVAGAVRSRDKALVSARFPKRSAAAPGPGAGAGGAAAAAAGQAAAAQGLGVGAAAAAAAEFPWDETELQLVYSLGQRFTFFVQVRGVCVEGLRDGWLCGVSKIMGGREGGRAGGRGREGEGGGGSVRSCSLACLSAFFTVELLRYAIPHQLAHPLPLSCMHASLSCTKELLLRYAAFSPAGTQFPLAFPLPWS